MSTVELRGVTKSFGTTRVLDGIDLSVADGELVALLGPSGCGKTTLLRLVAGLERLDAGEIEVGGELRSSARVHVPPERRHVGLVFQNGALFPHLSVAENVGFGLPRPERRRSPRIDELLEIVGLGGTGDRRPEALSGGQQQRVALARALAPQPDVLLLDEPFSNLDAELRERLRREVRRIVRELGTTAVFVTHDQAEAFALGDRVAVMEAGRLAQVAPPLELYRHPTDRWVATFVGDGSFLPGTATGEVVQTAAGRVVAPGSPDGEVEVLVRPEQVRLATDPAGPGAVVEVEFAGATSTAVVALGEGASIESRWLGGPLVAVGDQVQVTIEGPVTAFPA